MSYYDPVVTELALVGLADASVANKERVILRPTQLTSLREFGLVVGVRDPGTDGAKPLFDNTFWFPDLHVAPPSWVLVYTGPGTPREDTLPNGDRVLTLFWQRKQVVFTRPELVPILFRVGAANVGRHI